MNLFMREMKASRKSLIIWCVCMILMVASGMSKYGALSTSAKSMTDVIAQMPKSLKTILGIGDFDITKAIDYYGILFMYLVLMATIHALILGANIIAKEERDKTSEFLIVKPISRNQIITSKLLAAFVNILIMNLITLVTSIKMVAQYNKGVDGTGKIIILLAGLLFLQLLFMFLGSGIAATMKKPKAAVSLGTGMLLVTFMLSMIIDISGRMDSLKYFTPFKYYETKNILMDGSLDPIFVTLSVVIIGILLSITYIFYNKRDMNV
jgi:ABC-2 type transport system permease protein